MDWENWEKDIQWIFFTFSEKMIKFVRYTISPHSTPWFHSLLWKRKGNWSRNVSRTSVCDRYWSRAGQPSYWPIFSCRWQQSKFFGKVNSAQFTSCLKWRIAKTMKVAISRFDNAKPVFVMLIQLLTHSLVYVWQRANTHKYSKDCPENTK